MSSSVVVSTAVLVLCSFIFYVTRRLQGSKYKTHLPPGPRPYPLIGNILDMPTQYQHLTFTEWADKWGDIISVTIFGRCFVVLNSIESALDLLEKKGAIYSDRPYMPLAGELMGHDQFLPLSPYGERYRDLRRLLHRALGGRGQLDKVERYHSLVEGNALRFAQRLLRSPGGFEEHSKWVAASISLKIAYGYNIKEDGPDEIHKLVEKVMESFIAASTPGSFMVDSWPALRHLPSWLPGSNWRILGKKWRAEAEEMCDVPYQMAKASGADDNFVGLNLDFVHDVQTDHHLKMAAASIYAGGADTTVSSIVGFFLAMTIYGDVQKKAQAEIDKVVGNERLPSLADREHLPYVNALCSEVFRWIPIGPLALPHVSTEDGTYKGHFIPKGSVILGNVWKMLHDPQVYHDPISFKPERFLSTSGHVPEQDPRVACFGFGRRICPGMNLAEIMVFMVCTMTLALFDIRKVMDENGHEITPTAGHTSGTISHPKPFKCSIKPRSAKAEALIHSL